jgi:hypothetical protein
VFKQFADLMDRRMADLVSQFMHPEQEVVVDGAMLCGSHVD